MAEHGQYAALPYMQIAGDVRVCLITSRSTKRWVIPKGWPKTGLRPHELAAREAEEEAGLIGEISTDPIGTYSYRKRLHFFASVTCKVVVYPLLVQAQQVRWSEQAERELAWVPIDDAARMVSESDLGALMATLPGWIAARTAR